MESVIVEEYNPRSLKISWKLDKLPKTESSKLRENLKEIGSKFNNLLAGGPGWILPATRRGELVEMLRSLGWKGTIQARKEETKQKEPVISSSSSV